MDPAIGRQNPTRRRMSIAASMREDAYRLQEVQQAFRKMADAVETSGANSLPKRLISVNSRQSLYEILLYGRTEDAEARDWLKDKITGRTPEQERAERIKALERDIWSYKIDGFFPTPKSLVEEMLRLPTSSPANRFSNRAPGKGDIAEMIWEQGNSGQLELIEINHTLCDLLTEKGFKPHCMDFMKMGGDGFDRVIMNPPFENGQDIDHVRHAYECLAPGGRLVAIMCEGSFYRKDKKSTEFFEQ